MSEQVKSLVEQFGEVSEALMKLYIRTLGEYGIDRAKFVMEAFANIEMMRQEMERAPWE